MLNKGYVDVQGRLAKVMCHRSVKTLKKCEIDLDDVCFFYHYYFSLGRVVDEVLKTLCRGSEVM